MRRMRSFQAVLMAAAVAAAGFSSNALAADMPVKAAPMIASAYNWTGLYAGAVGTYGWGDGQHCESGLGFPDCLATYPQTNLTGWEGGANLGYNWQWAGWVFGVEGDWSWGKLKGSSASTATFSCGGGGATCDTWISSVGTARARVGYAFDRFLPYLTAGAAFSDLHGANASSTGSATKTNFVWGVGLEYAFWQNFSAKVEYLNITEGGDVVYNNSNAGGCGSASPCFVHVGSINLVRFGVNYKFYTP